MEFIQYLEAKGLILHESSGNLGLFQKNFVIKNALYSLQEELVKEGFYLEISPIKTQLLPITAQGKQQLASTGENNLRRFYSDWDNCEGATEASVQGLLDSFWQRYCREDKRPQAYQVLGLDVSATAAEIKQRYRQLAAENHPDKGGDSSRFMEIREAYEVLKAY